MSRAMQTSKAVRSLYQRHVGEKLLRIAVALVRVPGRVIALLCRSEGWRHVRQ